MQTGQFPGMGRRLRLLHRRLAGRRCYPIKKNDEGRSARQRAFALFDNGYKPAMVAAQVEISTRTAQRYYADWKRRPEKYDERYLSMQELLRNPVTRALIAQQVANELHIPVAAVLPHLSEPWAVKQLITGEWRNWAAEEREKRDRRRLQAATRVIEMYERRGISLDRICAELDGLLAKVVRDGASPPDATPRPNKDPFAKLPRFPPNLHLKARPRDEFGMTQFRDTLTAACSIRCYPTIFTYTYHVG